MYTSSIDQLDEMELEAFGGGGGNEEPVVSAAAAKPPTVRRVTLTASGT